MAAQEGPFSRGGAESSFDSSCHHSSLVIELFGLCKASEKENLEFELAVILNFGRNSESESGIGIRFRG